MPSIENDSSPFNQNHFDQNEYRTSEDSLIENSYFKEMPTIEVINNGDAENKAFLNKDHEIKKLKGIQRVEETEKEEMESSEDERKTSRDRKNSIIDYKEEINNQFQPISRVIS